MQGGRRVRPVLYRRCEMLKLSPRLQKIYSYIKPGESLIDVGTDHGYIPVRSAEENICTDITAADINKGPIESAKKAALNAGVYDKISFFQTDGLTGIPPIERGSVVIAGMGGETTVKILSGVKWLKKEGVRLILQPQSKIEELTEYLYGGGFFMSDAGLVKDEGRIYIVMVFEYGRCPEPPEPIKMLRDRKDPLLKELSLIHISPLFLRRPVSEYFQTAKKWTLYAAWLKNAE